jgi:hypothetical protein
MHVTQGPCTTQSLRIKQAKGPLSHLALPHPRQPPPRAPRHQHSHGPTLLILPLPIERTIVVGWRVFFGGENLLSFCTANRFTKSKCTKEEKGGKGQVGVEFFHHHHCRRRPPPPPHPNVFIGGIGIPDPAGSSSYPSCPSGPGPARVPGRVPDLGPDLGPDLRQDDNQEDYLAQED